MISSADYWATVFVIVSFAVMVLVSRRTAEQIRRDRESTRHAHTVRLLGDGDRVVLAKTGDPKLPYRVTDKPKGAPSSGRVYGFATLGSALAFSTAKLKDQNIDPKVFDGVPLHHPSLDRRR